MLECSKRPRDIFLASSERSIDRYLLKTLNGNRHPGWRNVVPTFSGEPREPGSSRRPIPDTRINVSRRTTVRGFWERVGVAGVGGFFLVGPMWLMALHNTLYTDLVTTTACVAAFGLLTSWTLDKPMDVLSSTAATAAVWVVFVGLNSDPSTV